MESQRMDIYGVGPKIMRPTVLYGIISVALTFLSPKTFLMSFMPEPVFHIAGGILLGFGISFLYISNKAMRQAVAAGTLETNGTFAIIRNPLYFAWMFFIFTGIALTSQAWLIFGMSAVAYYRFTKLVSQEEDLLENLFGDEFTKYKANVPRIIPQFK